MSESTNTKTTGCVLIADAGATKTDWLLADDCGRTLLSASTDGIHALTTSEDRLHEILGEVSRMLPEGVRPLKVALYGAGCGLPEVCSRMAATLRSVFEVDEAEACSDMLGMARAILGHEAGVACILGTGSNSCHYNGREIVYGVPALGYVLGDEGGGVGIGKRFLRMLLKNKLPQECKIAAENAGFGYAEVIRRVYGGEKPNSYIASVVPVVKNLMHIPEVRKLVEEEFEIFMRLNLTDYPGSFLGKVGFGGSIAAEFEPELRSAAERCGIGIGKIMRRPMSGLLDYYTQL